MVITPLDKAWALKRPRKRRASTANLSALQHSLLKNGLEGWLRDRPLDLACKLEHPGHFGLKKIMTKFTDRTERARRRAAAGLAVARLINRGLLERCTRGKWRLSPAGVAYARKLYPQIKPPTKRELAHRIALRKALTNIYPTRRRRRAPRSGRASSKKPVKPGVQVQLDCSTL